MGRSVGVIFFLPLSPSLPPRDKRLPFSGPACRHPQGRPPSSAARHCRGLWLSLLGHALLLQWTAPLCSHPVPWIREWGARGMNSALCEKAAFSRAPNRGSAD